MNDEMKTGKDFKDGILREQVRLVMSQLSTMQTASFIVALVLSYTVRHIVLHRSIIVWLLMVLVIVVTRIVLYFRFLKVRDEPFDGEYWKKAYLITALISGIFWGLSAFMIFPAGNTGLMALFVLVMASLSAATTVSHSSIRLGPVVWAGPALFLYAIRCVLEGGEIGYPLGLLIVVYLITIVRYSFTHNRAITSSISLKFENLKLLDEVQKSQEILERMVEERTAQLKNANRTLVAEIEERRLLADALRKSEEKYRELVEHANSIILRWDREGTVTFANEFALKFFGYEEHELVGKGLTETILHGISREELDLGKMIRDICRSPQELETEYHECLRRNGERAWISWSHKPILSDRGELIEMLSIGQDMTARKLTEDALQIQEERLRFAMTAAQQGWFDVNVQTGEVSVGPEYVSLVGDAPTELHTNLQVWIDGIHPEDRDAALEAYRDCLDSGETRTIEYRRLTNDGEWRWIRSTGKVVAFDSENKPLRMTGTHTDISERKRVEAALQESQERFRELAELLPETIFETDPDGRLTFVNQSAFSQFGYCPEDIEKGLSGFDIVSMEDRPRAIRNSERIMSGEKIGLIEYKARRKDGGVFPVMIRAASKVHQGKAVGLRGIVIDITETKKLEAQLRQAHKMEAIGTLAGGIAHDFNNILAAIIGYTEMVQSEVSEWSTAYQDLKEVLKASYRARDLVKQILTFSRMKGDQKPVPVEIGKIIGEAAKMLRATIPTSIEILQSVSCEDCLVLADPTQIHQILVNLCTNSSHAMREKGGVLKIGLDSVELGSAGEAAGLDLEPGPYVRLTISDTGHGMDAATIERIFEPYFTTKGLSEGSGLGLAVVHGIVKRCGGAIAVQSEPGKGATFRVYLPTLASPSTEGAENDVPIPQGNERILFVDDEEAMAALGQRVLGQLGYSVIALTSSKEALDLYRSNPGAFDLLITDYTMPQMTGGHLAGEILKIRPDMPILMCTGFNEQISDESAKRMGIAGFVMKPINRRELAEAVRKALQSDG